MNIFKSHVTLKYYLLIGLICFGFFTISTSDAVETVSLQLKWKHQFQFAGYYAAIEKGYYAEEGLDVTLIEAKPGGNEITEVVSGQANFGVGMADLVLSRIKGEPVVVLANIFQHSPSIFLTTKKSGINTIHDLPGKKVMMNPGYKSAELQAMILNEGIALDKVKFIKPSWNIDDLIDGEIDVLTAYISSQPFVLEKKNVSYNIISPTTYGIDFYGDNLFTTESELEQHPDRTEAFRKASLKGWRYALEHPEEIIDLILSKYTLGRKNITREFLVNEAAAYQKLILPKFVAVGHINPGRWKHIADTYVKLGMVDKKYNLKGFLYEQTSLEFDWGHWVIKWGIGAIIIGFAGTLFMLFFNRRLNHEIHGRKQKEKALSESEERFRSLFENAPIGYQSLNMNGDILELNETWCKLLGYTKEEVLGRNFSEFIHPDFKEVFKENFPKFKSMGYILGVEFEMIKKEGSEIIVAFDGKIGHNDDGSFKQTHCVLSDITKRKTSEDRLRESEEKFRNISENSLVGVYIIQDGLFKYVNPKFAEIFGYSINECLDNMHFSRLVYPNDLDTVQEQVRKRVEGEVNSVNYAFRGVRKSGKIIHVEIFGSSIILNGKDSATGTMLDITKRNELETQLQQAQKMESIGNLAGGIAHDFNNILSSVIGFTELALDDVVKGTPQEDNLQEVYTAGKRARDLVKQILAFARQSDEERKPIQVDSIAKEVLKLIRSTIPTTIEVREDIQSHSLIKGNPTQVHQLFMNLCTNAAHAMEKTGGILEVGLTDVIHNDQAPLPLSGLKSGNYIKVTISDTGSGISPNIIDSIFEPYFTTKGVGEGTGMGLALAHGIVESYGGNIAVESELGKGTIFSIYLPILKIYEDSQVYEKEELPSGTERILFVDDELPIAKMGSLILERLGYQVTVRTSSVEALELFRSKPNDFDLVISDMTMPNMTGDELAMELIAIRSDIPIILCTGYSKKITEETALEIGIKAFAYKPLVKLDLAKTVRKVLDESKDAAHA